jgi:hypothetical protein
MGGAGLFTLITPYNKPTNTPAANDISIPFIAPLSVSCELPIPRRTRSERETVAAQTPDCFT